MIFDHNLYYISLLLCL